jgi:hypothetical protein
VNGALESYDEAQDGCRPDGADVGVENTLTALRRLSVCDLAIV